MNVLIFLGLILVPIIIIQTSMPYLTRKTVSFGISIEEKYFYEPELKRMRKSYASLNICAGILCIVAAALLLRLHLDDQQYAVYFIGIIITYFLIGLLIYLYFRSIMMRIKAQKKWLSPLQKIVIIDTTFRNRPLHHSNIWFLIPLILICLSAGMTAANYDLISDPIVMKTDLQGNPTSFADKTVWNVFLINLIQLVVLGVMLGGNAIIKYAKQQIDATKPEESILRNVIFRRRWSLFTIVTSVLISIMLCLIQLDLVFHFSKPFLTILNLSIIGIVLLGSIILGLITGQGGSKIKLPGSPDSQPVQQGNVQDDQYWKAGIFYYNPNDASIFIEKRMGIGWSINFARPMGWVLLLLPLAIIILIASFTG